MNYSGLNALNGTVDRFPCERCQMPIQDLRVVTRCCDG